MWSFLRQDDSWSSRPVGQLVPLSAAYVGCLQGVPLVSDPAVRVARILLVITVLVVVASLTALGYSPEAVIGVVTVAVLAVRELLSGASVEPR